MPYLERMGTVPTYWDSFTEIPLVFLLIFGLGLLGVVLSVLAFVRARRASVLARVLAALAMVAGVAAICAGFAGWSSIDSTADAVANTAGVTTLDRATILERAKVQRLHPLLTGFGAAALPLLGGAAAFVFASRRRSQRI